MSNVHEEILEILCNFMVRVHDSGKDPKNKLEFLEFRSKPRHIMKNLYHRLIILIALTI